MERSKASVSGRTATNLRDRRRQTLRQELRLAALALFEQQGVAATTVDEIAASAGVSRSTFFRHFGSKHAILAGEADENALLYLSMLGGRPAGDGRLEALEGALVELVQAIRSDERRDEMVAIDRIVNSDPTLHAMRAEISARARDDVARVLAVRGGRTEPDIDDALAAAILTVITERVGAQWYAAADGRPVADLIRSHFDGVRRLVAS